MGEQIYTQKPQRDSITLSFSFPAKYRRVVLDAGVDKAIASVCLEIEKRYEIKFLEIGSDEDHIHFLVQSVPMYT
jgi:REP element-mobilizing transposase RayT